VSVRPPPSRVCHVLREDPELAEPIEAGRREQAIQECTAPEVWVPPGNRAADGPLFTDTGIGLLVLEGVLIRRVGINEHRGAEVLGNGDLLRPWQGEPESSTLPLTAGWLVVQPARFAVLDERFVDHVGRFPELAVSLVDRAVQRSRNLMVNMAIVHQARVDVRLHLLLWHLAGRWGTVRSIGTVLPLRLTHDVLADLVAARRPTVTTALSELARRGLVRWEVDAWVLTGEAPGELLNLKRAAEAHPSYVDRIEG
jgi:CRP/FNR family transcriptional regulator, cyclic AMP receptor protein